MFTGTSRHRVAPTGEVDLPTRDDVGPSVVERLYTPAPGHRSPPRATGTGPRGGRRERSVPLVPWAHGSAPTGRRLAGPAAGDGPVSSAARSGDPPVALTVAGSDSASGAGIQADLKAMSALGVFAATAVTVVTAQNTVEVREVITVPPALVDAQISAVLDDLAVAAVKTGMLATAEVVEVVAGRAAAGDLPRLVVDPVMVASDGRRLLDDAGLAAYRRLLPHALLTTPNLGRGGPAGPDGPRRPH